MPNSSPNVSALFRPIRINELALANRVVLGPMAVLSPTEDGRPSDQTIAFLTARARGGVGLIIVGGAIGTQRGYDESPYKPILRWDEEAYLPDLKRVADAVHAFRVPIIAEVMPSFGRMGVPGKGRPIISASPINVVMPQDRFPKGMIVPGGRTTPMPDEATIAEIQQMERETVESALRVQRAGWDGVEIAAHMSYFAASFLSPRTNWRKDEYGGSTENRARMLVNIVKRIRATAGPSFPIGLRITANEHLESGQGPEGYAAIARLVEQAGVDYVAMSDGCYETMDMSAPDKDGGMIAHGEASIFKRALSVPLLLQGIHDPDSAGRAIEQGHADMIMLARPLLADPNYVRKLREGKADTIIKCDRDNYCMRRLVMNMPMRCSANPETGRESRAPGKLPPISRLFAAPLEAAVLALTSSPKFMGLIGFIATRLGRGKRNPVSASR